MTRDCGNLVSDLNVCKTLDLCRMKPLKISNRIIFFFVDARQVISGHTHSLWLCYPYFNYKSPPGLLARAGINIKIFLGNFY